MENPGITRAILEHYASSEEPLLLSQLGQKLKNSGEWPIDGDDRNLSQVLTDLTPQVDIIKESPSGSYAIVIPPEYKRIADIAIQHRNVVRYLNSLPRVVLLAFCVNEVERPVYIKAESPYNYIIDSDYHDPDYLFIDLKYRIPGLYITNISSLSIKDAEELANKIRDWSLENEIQFNRSKSATESLHPSKTNNGSKETTKSTAGTALDRLYDAQRPEIAQGMNIPLDIAQLLSRIP